MTGDRGTCVCIFDGGGEVGGEVVEGGGDCCCVCGAAIYDSVGPVFYRVEV